MQVAWALVLLWTGSFERLLIYCSVGLTLFSMLTVSAVYVLRWRRPDLPRPFRTPGYPIVPAIYLVATGLVIAAVFSERPRGLDLCAAEHPGGRPGLLPLGRIQGPRQGGDRAPGDPERHREPDPAV